MKLNIIGLPDHEGVKNVGGRVGTKFGPEAFKIFFDKLNGDEKFQEYKKQFSALNFENQNLEEKHQQVINVLSEKEKQTDLTVIVGGGHDFIYSHTAGISKNKKVSVINIDPHLDMRPYDTVFTSGSPFRRLLNEEILEEKNLVEFGIQKHANAPALFRYAESKNTDIVFYDTLNTENLIDKFQEKLDKLSKTSDSIIISLDLDMIQASYAPGVSAPAVEGFTPEQVKDLLQVSARNKKVTSLGIYELNPTLDIDDRTARLAAYCAYYFIDEKRKTL